MNDAATTKTRSDEIITTKLKRRESPRRENHGHYGGRIAHDQVGSDPDDAHAVKANELRIAMSIECALFIAGVVSRARMVRRETSGGL